MGRSCGSLLQDTLLGHSCRTHLWVTLTGHSSGKLFWDTLVGHSCGSLLRDTLVGSSCGALLLWDTLTGHSCGTLLSITSDIHTPNISNHPAHQRHAASTPACFALPSCTAPRKRTSHQHLVQIRVALRHHERNFAARSTTH